MYVASPISRNFRFSGVIKPEKSAAIFAVPPTELFIDCPRFPCVPANIGMETKNPTGGEIGFHRLLDRGYFTPRRFVTEMPVAQYVHVES